jgi:hypothetical protein
MSGEGTTGSGSGGSGTGPSGSAVTSAGASSGTETTSGTEAELTLSPIPVDIIEFEDTLFHDNSCVIMPEVPQESSSGGSGSSSEEQPLTGVKALGMAFLFAGMYPERGFLVTGHTASQSDIPDSFRLSRERAAGVMYLLRGQVTQWGTNCAGRQTVRDIKRILKYTHEYEGSWKSSEWNCDPCDVDDTWNEATQTALNNFARAFSADLTDEEAGVPSLPENLGDLTNDATDHRLAQTHWRAIYHLYIQFVCDFLGKTRTELETMRNTVHWVSDAVKSVGCGHSYAVPSGERGDDKIRSETDSRIELLIYRANEQEQDALATCPTLPISAVHDLEEECPLWHERHFLRNYVGPGDRFAVVYHIKFKYFDRIKKDFQDMPGRLRIRTYKRAEATGSTPVEIPCLSQYQDGVHSVRVRFGEENPNFANTHLYFMFEADDKMIHTAGPDATSRMVDRPDDYASKSFAEQYQYHTVPAKWYSFNYFTRHEGTPAHDERFQEHIKDKRQLKPYGSNVTAFDDPLVFSFDDVVLMDQATGHDQNIQDADQQGTAKALCHGGADPGSRVKVFIADAGTDSLALWEKPNDDHTSAAPPSASTGSGSGSGSSSIASPRAERIRFERNIVSGMAPNAKIIHFRDGFYTIRNDRTADQPANWMDLAHRPVVGARKAVREDPDRHLHWVRKVHSHEFGYTGDYELHYFHQLHLVESHPVSYTIVHASMNVMLDTRGAQSRTAWAAVAANPGMADIGNFVNEGVYNANTRWNQKGYFWDETTMGDDTIRVFPMYLFEERETFEIPLADAPNNIEFGPGGNAAAVFTNAGYRAAEQRAFGGPVRWVCFIVPEATGSWAWSCRGGTKPHSLMRLRKSTYQTDSASWAYNSSTYSEAGGDFNCFVLAHELGHVTSLQDEYINSKRITIGTANQNYTSFQQHLIQYSMNPNNDAVIMYHNGAPRMRHEWYKIHFVNDFINNIPSGDDHMLKNKQFVLRHTDGSIDHTFTRHTGWNPSGAASPPAGSASIKGDMRSAVISEGQYRLPNFVSVSTGPDLSTLDATLQAKVRHDSTDNLLFWTDNGAMTDPERDAMRGLFTATANKDAVNLLQKKSRSLRRLSLSLHDTAQDESSEGATSSQGTFTDDQNNYRYHGVLVVRVMIGVATAAPAMSDADTHNRIGAIESAWRALGGDFRLTGGPAELENIYVHFLGGFQAQADAGTNWNYALRFRTTFGITVSTAPIATAMSTGLQALASYDNGTHRLSYNGVMTDAHRNELQAALTSAADRQAVQQLYLKTWLTSADGRIDIVPSTPLAQMEAHFLNMERGGDKLAALKFLEMWMNDKLSASYTLERISSSTTGTGSPTGGSGASSPSPAPAPSGAPSTT